MRDDMENAVTTIPEQNIVPANEPAKVLEIISRVASDPSADIDKLERLMAMHERMEKANAERLFNESMTAAQLEMGRISTDATNPQTRSRYATYAQLDRHLRPVYTRHGFALSFDESDSPKDEHIRVICHVSHQAGFTRTYHRDMPIVSKGIKGNEMMTPTHANASAQSYGMRYLLKAIFNVAIGEDDDDGNGGPVARVTAQQVADLDAMITEIGVDKAAYLKFLKLDRLDDMPATAFTNAVKWLEAKRKQVKK